MSARTILAALALLASLVSWTAALSGTTSNPQQEPPSAAEDETDRGAMSDPNG